MNKIKLNIIYVAVLKVATVIKPNKKKPNKFEKLIQLSHKVCRFLRS